jgi:hypothetical protein
MKWLVVSPIVMFGFGHAMFTTVLSPNVPLIIKNNSELLPVCFSIMKVAEGVMITVFTQMGGWIRQTTGNYSGVTMLLISCNLVALIASKQLVSPELFVEAQEWLSTIFGAKSTFLKI